MAPHIERKSPSEHPPPDADGTTTKMEFVVIFDVHADYFPAKYLDALESVGKPDIAELRAQRDAGTSKINCMRALP